MASYVGSIANGVKGFAEASWDRSSKFFLNMQKNLKEGDTVAKAAQKGLAFFGTKGWVNIQAAPAASLLAATKSYSHLNSLLTVPATAIDLYNKRPTGRDLALGVNVLAINTLQFFKAVFDFKMIDKSRISSLAEKIPVVGTKVAGLNFNKIFQPLIAAVCTQNILKSFSEQKLYGVKDQLELGANVTKLAASALHIAKEYGNVTRFTNYIPGLEFAGAAFSFMKLVDEKSV